MLRLYAMREWLETNKLPASTVNMYIKGRQDYADMIKLCKHVLCRSDRREFLRAQLLSGMSVKDVNLLGLETNRLHRVRNYPDMPEGYILPGTPMTMSRDAYVEVALKFWHDVLEPLQFKKWDKSLSMISTTAKLGLIRTKCSTASMVRLCSGTEWMDMLEEVSHVPKLSATSLARLLLDDGIDFYVIRKMLGVSAGNQPRCVLNEERVAMYNILAEKYSSEINKVFHLLDCAQCWNIMNTALMEGKYLEHYQTGEQLISVARGVEHSIDKGRNPDGPVRPGGNTSDFF